MHPSLDSARLWAPWIVDEKNATLLALNVKSKVWEHIPFEIILYDIMNFFAYRILDESDGLLFVFQILYKASPLQEQYPLSIFA